MNSNDFITKDILSRIYLGDRRCMALHVDGDAMTAKLFVDKISFLKPGSETWDYHTEEDVIGGAIVFNGITSLSFSDPFYPPNDFVEVAGFRHNAAEDKGLWTVILRLGSCDAVGVLQASQLTISCRGVQIQKE